MWYHIFSSIQSKTFATFQENVLLNILLHIVQHLQLSISEIEAQHFSYVTELLLELSVLAGEVLD